ncbi:gamma carbonic anhydrase family protein [Acinetobacter qingfengensis]|uniref:Gamma carbonic anhydrase family protein n=1 Tax=Acinetobacter qingfengensis TaxID=1262585 RepID=A0A1E7RFI7_9GAMM|nr:gamma carbonic anhydrase family protein [Acinetobacter qingfengensis]KAA8731855.1 gamma carbonic anhydrase family protein [Acinetobacter qingfengensis]OEY98022.1 gamma carbonic anhydrase family protein [Acinetobacter qingfengensis]
MLYQLGNFKPKAKHWPWEGWVAETATVIGHVELGQEISVWFGAVIRADNAKISLGNYTNVQENAVLHTDAGIEMQIGDYVTIGHQATLHGCTIGNNTLIGINAVILNHAVIGKNCIIGANTLIPEGKIIPDNSVVMGTPGKVVKAVDDATVEKIKQSAAHYAAHYKQFKTQLKVHYLG